MLKLTELHLDDWTIARLLGHKGLGSVRHYRKMSNQVMADETRKVGDFIRIRSSEKRWIMRWNSRLES